MLALTIRKSSVPILDEIRWTLEYLPFTLHQRNYYKLFEQARTRAKLGFHCTFHDLRHTTASFLANAGVDLATIGVILGHKSDKRARVAVLRRIDRLSEGNFGEHRFLRDGAWELKIDAGPGYRVYYAQEGKTVILLLCAGAKRTQRQDIAHAVEYWNDHQSRS